MSVLHTIFHLQLNRGNTAKASRTGYALGHVWYCHLVAQLTETVDTRQAFRSYAQNVPTALYDSNVMHPLRSELKPNEFEHIISDAKDCEATLRALKTNI